MVNKYTVLIIHWYNLLVEFHNYSQVSFEIGMSTGRELWVRLAVCPKPMTTGNALEN